MSKSNIRTRLNSLGDSVPPSDTSEAAEMFEITPSVWSSGVATPPHEQYLDQEEQENCEKINLPNDILTADEREQVASFFAGLNTELFVSSSLANLYEGTGNKDDWRLMFTGIPIILFDKGCARSRTTLRITFCLAERGTCFALWQDTIDNLSEYHVIGPAFHTMRLSTNHSQTIGFSFDNSDAAMELWQYIEKLISDPENIALNVPGNKKKKNKQRKIKPAPLPPKSQISNPCQFHHVINVNAKDSERYYSLQAFVPKCDNKYRQ